MSDPREADLRPRERTVRFRPDIQGMRALAVLAIIAYHAGLDLYPGGFVTLDVFFVISGFLITHLLVAEIRRTGTLSLRDFYRRRARRILPAATVAAIGTVLASWLWLSLIAAEDAATDAIWAALFAANIQFARESTDYFALGEAPSPFQHYWSLSVEEQFYLGLPLVLLGSVLFATRRAGAPGSRGARPLCTAFWMMAAITLISFGWSIHASSVSPETAYFSTLTRTWEFGVGALLAMAAPKLARALTARARNLLALTGLAAIVTSCFTITPMTPYPGHAALLPVLGTGAIMVAGAELGARPTPVAQRMLGVGPLRLIGDASYSLYLWHWPVLTVATQHLGRELSPRGLAFAIVIVFALSFASYHWVETPFRRGLPQRWGQGLALYPAAVGAVALMSTAAIYATHVEVEDGGAALTTEQFSLTPEGEQLASSPAIAQVEASARAAAEGAPIPGELTPNLLDLPDDKADLGDCDYSGPPPWNLCSRGQPDADRTIVVLGNSHGRHWIPAFEKIREVTGHRAHYLVKPGCTPARVDKVRVGAEEPWDECKQFNAWAEEQLRELQPDLVVVSTSGTRRLLFDGVATRDIDVMEKAFRRGFAELYDAVLPHTSELVVLGDVPHRRGNPGECLSTRDATLDDCANEPDPRAARITAVSRTTAEDRNLRFIDTTRWFCSDQICPAVIGSTVPYRDESHITTAYAEELAEPLRRALKLTAE